MTVGGTLTVWSTGSVTLSGSTISTGFLVNEGSFDFLSGTLEIGADLLMDTSGPLDDAFTVSAMHTLTVGGTTTLNGASTLTLDGGVFSTGSLIDNGSFAFHSGTFNLTSDDLTIGTGGLFGSFAHFDVQQTVNVTNTTTIEPGAVLSLDEASFNSGDTINNGMIRLNGTIATLGGGALTNNNLVTGTGQITATMTNATTGELRVVVGDALQVTGSGAINSGDINLLGGSVEFTQNLTNHASSPITKRVAAGGDGTFTAVKRRVSVDAGLRM